MHSLIARCFRLCLLTSLLLGSAVCVAAPEGGVAFDGEHAYRFSPKARDTSLSGFTVSAWAKFDAVDTPQMIVNQGAANEHFSFYLYDDGVRMLVAYKENEYAKAIGPKPEAGAWRHYAGVYDGQEIRLYVDGKLTARAAAPGELYLAKSPFFIGAENAQKRFLKGALDGVYGWRRALSEAEIAGLVKAPPELPQDRFFAFEARQAREGTWGMAEGVTKRGVLINTPEDGYRGIWYFNQKSGDEYVYKYSGGLGTYCAKHIPHAWYAKEVNKTFFTYGGSYKGKNTLVHMVSYFDHTTGQVPRPTLLLDKETDDAHDNPVIGLDEQGYIWIFSSSHGTGRPSYISRSTQPYAVDHFELMWTGNYSYPQPWRIPGKGWLFMHTHYTKGRTICMMTSDDCVHWSDRVFLSRMAQGHYQVTRPFGAEKVGSAFNYHPEGKGLNWRTNLYYMETHDLGATWKTAGGKVLTPMLTDKDCPALVQEYESQGLNVYMKDITYDAAGHPVILYLTSKGYESGPENMPRTWTTARWTGSEWLVQPSEIISDNNYDTGSLYIESEDCWRIIGPTDVGPQPYNPGGEVALWISADQGAHWKKARQMTQNSPRNHTYVRRPVNAHPDFYGFWADGHGRQPSISQLYFCNQAGDVFLLPFDMDSENATPQQVN